MGDTSARMTRHTRRVPGLTPAHAGCLVAAVLAVASVAAAQDASTVSLDDAVAAARRQAPAVAAAALRATAARTSAEAVPYLGNPSLEARIENWGGGDRDDLTKDVFLVATQPIELAGRAGRRRAVAAADAAAAEAHHREVARAASLAVVRSYVDAVRVRDEVALLEDQAARLTRAVTTMRARVTEGVSAEGDLKRLESEHTRLAIALQRRLAERDLHTATLGLLIGRPVQASQLVTPVPTPPPTTAHDDVIEQHPAVATARLRAAAADALVAFEDAQRLPLLLVSGGYKRTSGVSTGVAALGLTLPVFDRSQSPRARARGEAAASHLEYEAARAAVRTEIAAQRAIAERLAAAATNLEALLLEPARIARDAAYAAVLEGSADVVKLVDADRAYADARLDALSLLADAVVAQRRLALMIGLE